MTPYDHKRRCRILNDYFDFMTVASKKGKTKATLYQQLRYARYFFSF